MHSQPTLPGEFPDVPCARANLESLETLEQLFALGPNFSGVHEP